MQWVIEYRTKNCQSQLFTREFGLQLLRNYPTLSNQSPSCISHSAAYYYGVQFASDYALMCVTPAYSVRFGLLVLFNLWAPQSEGRAHVVEANKIRANCFECMQIKTR